jgi:hypothetical protein
MKKGDIIEKRKDMPDGTILIRHCPDAKFADDNMLHIEKHYNFANVPRMRVESHGIDGTCIVLDENTHLSIQAKVSWVFEDEMAIEYLDTGGMVILNLKETENMGWVVIHEATPVYQDSVEHMTDDQLRQSIEDLRARRLSAPVSRTKAKAVRLKEPAQTAEDKQLSSVLDGMDASAKMELMKKLGLLD